MEFLKRFFRDSGDAPLTSPIEVETPALALRLDTTFPIVSWEEMDSHAPPGDDPRLQDAYWTTVAREWLALLRTALGNDYAIHESDHFLLLGALSKRQSRSTLDFCEKSRRRILRLLEGIASNSGSGKTCILVFRDHDSYYQYVSNYYPPEGEFSLSGGMFLHQGYGHFVFVESEGVLMEPVIVHELAHCLMQHLPIPAWINEGIAVNTERRLCQSAPPLETHDEMAAMHRDFWTSSTIQEFWSGKSWSRPDEANKLSYDLATKMIGLCSGNSDVFRAFVTSANFADSGNASANKHLGCSVGALAHAVLGEGNWEPMPEQWVSGVDRGQF